MLLAAADVQRAPSDRHHGEESPEGGAVRVPRQGSDVHAQIKTRTHHSEPTENVLCVLQVRQADNPQFSFLHPDDPLHPYYNYMKVSEAQANAYPFWPLSFLRPDARGTANATRCTGRGTRACGGLFDGPESPERSQGSVS